MLFFCFSILDGWPGEHQPSSGGNWGRAEQEGDAAGGGQRRMAGGQSWCRVLAIGEDNDVVGWQLSGWHWK
jgi:hypothetical protein